MPDHVVDVVDSAGAVRSVPLVAVVKHRRSPCCNAAWRPDTKRAAAWLFCSQCGREYRTSEVYD